MNALTWFEIPTQNFDRAVGFYSTILAKPLQTMLFDGEPTGIFPYEAGKGVGGCVIYREGQNPTMDGSIVYLSTGTATELEAILGRVEAAGGKVLMPKTHIGDPGYIAMFSDTEGNRVGLNGE